MIILGLIIYFSTYYILYKYFQEFTFMYISLEQVQRLIEKSDNSQEKSEKNRKGNPFFVCRRLANFKNTKVYKWKDSSKKTFLLGFQTLYCHRINLHVQNYPRIITSTVECLSYILQVGAIQLKFENALTLIYMIFLCTYLSPAFFPLKSVDLINFQTPCAFPFLFFF